MQQWGNGTDCHEPMVVGDLYTDGVSWWRHAITIDGGRGWRRIDPDAMYIDPDGHHWQRQGKIWHRVPPTPNPDHYGTY